MLYAWRNTYIAQLKKRKSQVPALVRSRECHVTTFFVLVGEEVLWGLLLSIKLSYYIIIIIIVY